MEKIMKCLGCGYEGPDSDFATQSMGRKRRKCKNCWNIYARKYGRLYRAKHPTVRQGRRANLAIASLRKALRMIGPLKNGWPDDGCSIELKIGWDGISINQFRRFAWLYRWRGVTVLIRIANSHETCASNHEDLEIPEYLNRICGKRAKQANALWKQLVMSIGEDAGSTTHERSIRT
jgi:hypothetical protein